MPQMRALMTSSTGRIFSIVHGALPAIHARVRHRTDSHQGRGQSCNQAQVARWCLLSTLGVTPCTNLPILEGDVPNCQPGCILGHEGKRAAGRSF